ncbi:MAG: radical SAM protein [Thermoguttaceae bacterium]
MARIQEMSYLSFYPEVLRLRRGLPIAPRMAIVHPTNRCQHRCSGCEYAATRATSGTAPASIDGDRLLSLIGEIRALGAAAILFSGGGEPTLHHRFAEAVSSACEADLSVGIFSNGVNIRAPLANTIARHASFVRISIDAATAGTYQAIRGADDFARCMEGFQALSEAKACAGSTIQLGLKYLVRAENVGEILAFCDLAEELGAESVQFKPLRGDGELPPEGMREAQRLIDRAKDQERRVRIVGGMPKDPKIEAPTCWINPLRVVVSAEGDVYLCNYFMHRRNTHVFGNIVEEPLQKIWFGTRHREAMGRISASECCFFDCRFHKLNVQLRDLVTNHRDELDFV